MAAIDDQTAPVFARGDVVAGLPGTVAALILESPASDVPGSYLPLRHQGVTARLEPTGAPRPLHAHDAPKLVLLSTRMRPLPYSTEEDVERVTADLLSPDAIAYAEARHLQIENLALPGQVHAEDTEYLGYLRAPTVRIPRIVALGGATVGSLTALKASEVWAPMRTLDAREARSHYYPWVSHLSEHVQHIVVSRWIRLTQAEYLPGRVRDLYMRRLHSSFHAGDAKRSNGWQYCARCRRTFGLSQCNASHVEDVLHMCHTCPCPGGAASVMHALMHDWRATTGQELAPRGRSGPLALFGDRRYGCTDEEAAPYIHLEQPWRVLHAAVVLSIEAARRHAAPRARHKDEAPPNEASLPAPRTLAQIVAKARREACKMANALLIKSRRDQTFPTFFDCWIATGIAEFAGPAGALRVKLLAPQRRTPPPSGLSILCFATDGSADRASGRAGWSSVARRLPPHGDDHAAQPGTTLVAESGPVILDSSHPEFLGAATATNNSGELSAVCHALREAHAHVQRGEEVLILSDSRLAINTTVGAWATKKHKALVARAREALAKLRRVCPVRLKHVRAHAGHYMNEQAAAMS